MATPTAVFPAVPPNLKPLQICMKVASDVEKSDPVVAYWCRFYVVQTGIKLDNKSKESQTFLFSVMDWLEKQKKLLKDNEAVTNEMAAEAHVENFALKLFDKADSDDRAGVSNKSTFRLFFLSSTLFDVLSVWGETPEEIKQRCKYAKWKATYINKCLRNGETPTPGPVAGTDAEEFGAYERVEPAGFVDSQNDMAGLDNLENSTQPQTQQPQQPQQFMQPQQPPEPRLIPETTKPAVVSASGVSLTHDELAKAQKFCKFAGSALQFEDVPTAIENLQKALSLLMTGKEN